MLLTTSNLDANESGHPKRGVIGIRLGSRSIERVGSVHRELCALDSEDLLFALCFSAAKVPIKIACKN